MCGISGILSENPDLDQMERMLKVMRHRGPEGTFYAELTSQLNKKSKALFGFLSLAFTDLAGGAQPMFNEDKTIFAVCNGEFYDYKQIREELTQKGHKFFTQSDSEISVHLYEEYGLDMFQHMNGEFAFAVYDSNRDLLIMARDRFGVKPLFFHKKEKEFIFASECKSLLSIMDRREMNPDYYNSTGFGICETSTSPFLGIHSIRPGHFGILKDGQVEQKPYWEPDFKQRTNFSYEDNKKKLRELVLQGIERRIDTDIPIATTLSGGMDSTIITGLAKKEFGREFNSVTLGYKESRFSESPIAKMTADHFGINLERVELENQDLIDNYLLSHYHSESITKDFSTPARLLLNRAIKNSGHKAVLSGEGPDEIFGGYAYFKLGQIRSNILKGGEKKRIAEEAFQQFLIDEKKSEGLLWTRTKDWKKYIDILGNPLQVSGMLANGQKAKSMILSKEMNQKIGNKTLMDSFSTEFNLESFKRLSPFNQSRLISRGYFATFIAPTLGDRSEMASCLEGRAPFLDRDVLNFAYTLNEETCFDQKTFQGKNIVADTFSDIIPEHFATIKKQPFRSPTVHSILQNADGKNLFNTLLSRKNIKEAGIFNPNTIAAVKLGWKLMSKESSHFRKLDMDMGYFMSHHALKHIFIDHFDKFIDLSDLDHPMIERKWDFA